MVQSGSLVPTRNSSTHKCMAWRWRGCGRIPKVEKLAIIWAKMQLHSNISEVVSIFSSEAK